MNTAKQHWKILQKLESDLAKRVRLFMVIGQDGEGLMVATEDGEVFWLGKVWFNENGETKTTTKPTPLYVPGVVEHMAQGVRQIVLLNNHGQIYTFGLNGDGKLGLGINKNKFYFTPQLISIPHKFISVRCGWSHSLALTENGKVWTWGENLFGEAGVRSSLYPIHTPRQIIELDSQRVIAVDCGAHHSIALTDRGEVYAWGLLQSGQLDEDRIEITAHIPTQIPTPSPVKSMASGYKHTLLLTQTGEVYDCFRKDCDQHGVVIKTKTNPRLNKVLGLPPISQIAISHVASLSIAMSFDQRCFIWGILRNEANISTPRKLPSFYSTVESPLSYYSSYRTTPHSVTIPDTPPSPLSARMSRLFDNPETSDVQFVVEQRTIHANRTILSNSSDYFARMFSKEWIAPVKPEDPIVKVTIPDHHSYQAFHVFLRYLYTDSLELNSNLLPELLELANLYLIPDLQQLCRARMGVPLSTTNTCCPNSGPSSRKWSNSSPPTSSK